MTEENAYEQMKEISEYLRLDSKRYDTGVSETQ